MKLKKFISKAVSTAMCAMIIGTTIFSVNVKADTKESMETTEELDTHVDDGVAGILEKDDFENPEDYQKYLESHPQVQKQRTGLAARATANKNVKAKATLKYKIVGLPSTAAIQKTYIGSTYIYVIQRSGSIRQSGSNRVLPNNSCQGLELTDADSIYVIGGAAGDTPKIAKMTGSGSNYKYACLATVTHSNFGSSAEAEGIQLKGDYVYFGISDKSRNDRACIYSIPKSSF